MEDLNTAQRALMILAQRDDFTPTSNGNLTTRRLIAVAGTFSDGHRTITVKLCDRARWVMLELGWDTILEIDQRDHHDQPEAIAKLVLAKLDVLASPYRVQLTKAGEQYMIPGTEPEDRPKTAQLSLF